MYAKVIRAIIAAAGQNADSTGPCLSCCDALFQQAHKPAAHPLRQSWGWRQGRVWMEPDSDDVMKPAGVQPVG